MRSSDFRVFNKFHRDCLGRRSGALPSISLFVRPTVHLHQLPEQPQLLKVTWFVGCAPFPSAWTVPSIENARSLTYTPRTRFHFVVVDVAVTHSEGSWKVFSVSLLILSVFVTFLFLYAFVSRFAEHHYFQFLFSSTKFFWAFFLLRSFLSCPYCDQIFHPLTWCHLLAFSEISRKSICIGHCSPLSFIPRHKNNVIPGMQTYHSFEYTMTSNYLQKCR